MTATTNVPGVTFGPTGWVAPSQQAVLTGVQEDVNSAFGGKLNPSLSTPQGQIASSEAAIIAQANSTFIYFTQQVDPAYASGRMQDAIGRIYFISRNPAQPTVVQCTCYGGQGVVIPVGALAQAEDGNIYTCTEAVTIPVGGSISTSFACNTVGPIACPAGTLNAIYQLIPGWDSIDNPDDGVEGNLVETRQAFETRRQQSVAQNSVNSVDAVLGAVLSVENVLDAYVTDNPSGSPATVGGAVLAAYSLYVAVVGGLASAVAQAIYSKKPPGIPMNGNTTQSVVLNNPAYYSPPYPTYAITWEEPPALPILFSVNIASNLQVPSNAATLIQNAIISAFAGGDGGPRARIGSTLYASRYFAPVAALGTWVQIISLQIGSANQAAAVVGGTISGTTLTVNTLVSGAVAVGQTLSDAAGNVLPGTTIVSGSGSSWQLSTANAIADATFTGTGSGANLTVTSVTGVIVVGMLLSGAGVVNGTTILSQTSGTAGGAGVYVTSISTTSSAAALTASDEISLSLADHNLVSVNINQTPTCSANNIAVTVT